MELRSTAPTTAVTAPLPKKGVGGELGQKDFLRLMLEQLTQQDPFNPVDNQAMVAQMAQFSSLAGVSETNERLEAIGEQLKGQTQILNRLSEAAIALQQQSTTTAKG